MATSDTSERQKAKASPKWLRKLYFWTGITATISYRLIIVLNNISSVAVKVAWYIGTIGFIIYFIHRYEVSSKRKQLIANNELVEFAEKVKGITGEQRKAMLYIFKTLKSTKEKWNYVFIFVASGVALMWGIWTDFIAPLF